MGLHRKLINLCIVFETIMNIMLNSTKIPNNFKYDFDLSIYFKIVVLFNLRKKLHNLSYKFLKPFWIPPFSGSFCTQI